MFRLELRTFGNENVRITFENLSTINARRDDILGEANRLNGNVVNEHLIYFNNSSDVLKLCSFIANL